jgi:hypothetical protein
MKRPKMKPRHVFIQIGQTAHNIREAAAASLIGFIKRNPKHIGNPELLAELERRLNNDIITS